MIILLPFSMLLMPTLAMPSIMVLWLYRVV